MNWASNKCGGKRFRTLPDNRIEIEGRGVPVYAPGSAEYGYLTQTWKNWGRLIKKHARKTGLPPSFILAIATKETGLWSDDKNKQASIGSPAGAQGIMQVMPCAIFQYGRFKDLVCNQDRQNPDASIHMGSVLLKAQLDSTGGFPAAASAYNAGGVKCYTGPTSNPGVRPNQFNWMNEHDYATKALTYNNTAVDMGVNGGADLMWLWLGGSIAATGALLFAASKGMLPLPRALAKLV